METYFPTFRRLAASPRPSFRSWWPRWTTAAQRVGLLRLIAVATEEKLPLVPLLEAWTADEHGIQRRRLTRLVDLLKQGTPLPDAVEQVRGVLRDEDVLAIRFGTQSGALAAAIRDRIEEQIDRDESSPEHRNWLLYIAMLVFFGALVVTFYQIKIAPEIYKILDEFKLEPPQVLEWSQRISDVVANYWWIGALLLIVALWFAFSARTGRFVRHVILGRSVRSLRELQSAGVLRKLSLAARMGRPVSGAISTLARYHFDPAMRHKLLYVRNEVEQGAEVWQSMSAAQLLTAPEQRVMETAERVGNRTWALRQLSATKQRRTMRHLQRVADLLLPALVLFVGAFVLFQALTVFVPLIKLIWSFAV